MTDPVPEPLPDASNAPPQKLPLRMRLRRIDPSAHSAKVTAVLAVLAAVSSGQYALQVSHTTLAQAEATDMWGYYQAKSIKKNVAQSQAMTIRAMAALRPEAAEEIEALAQKADAEAARYGKELDGIKADAEALEGKKSQHQRRGNLFNFAFIILQAGVILATVGESGKKRGLLITALLAGLVGALIAANAYLLWV